VQVDDLRKVVNRTHHRSASSSPTLHSSFWHHLQQFLNLSTSILCNYIIIICIIICQGLIGLAMERWRYLQSASLPMSPLLVLAPGIIREWYNTVHSDIIPILQLVRFALHVLLFIVKLIYCPSYDGDRLDPLIGQLRPKTCHVW